MERVVSNNRPVHRFLSPRTSVQQLVRTSAPASPLSGRQRGNRAPGRAAAGQTARSRWTGCGREAVVEGLRQPERCGGSGPSRATAPAMGAKPAGVVEPVELDRVEHRLAQRAELVRAVLLQVPRVVRLLRARAGRASADWASRRRARLLGPAASGSGARTSSGLADVLDRLQERDRVAHARAARSARPARARSSGPAARSAGAHARRPPDWHRRRSPHAARLGRASAAP